jgi:asparagine synthase (glutamine-hydrolysing)
MCGIGGELAYGRHSYCGHDAWELALQRMYRRGPDACGIWRHSTALLGARRLAISDPHGCVIVPMRSSDGECCLAYNGEIYNTGELRARYESKGWHFTTQTDTEVVLAALVHDGVSSLHRLNGIYALAFFDGMARSLTLARDPYGVKPLYVAEDQHGVAFCSELETLCLAHGPRRIEVPATMLETYLRLGYVPAGQVIADGVRMLEPGAANEYFSDGRVRRGGTTPSVRELEFDPRGDSPAADDLREVIRLAVTDQYTESVPTGCLLSGGVDSPVIASLMSEFSSPVRTFSVALPGTVLDESERAANIANQIGAIHSVVEIGDGDAERLFYDAVAATKEPLADEGILPTLAACSLASTQVKVVLAGDGADELFMGYTQRLSRAIHLNQAGQSLEESYFDLYSKVSNDLFKACFPTTNLAPSDIITRRHSGSGNVIDRARSIEMLFHLQYILLKADRASMFHSIEARVPYLDLRVASWALGRPARSFIDHDMTVGKLALRKVRKTLLGLPSPSKVGFTVPLSAWLAGPLEPLLRRAIDRVAGLEALDIDQKALRVAAQEHRLGRSENAILLWRVLLLDGWMTKVRALAAAHTIGGSTPPRPS